MSEYITAIRTDKGDKKIDYNYLANKPEFDANWKATYGLADATTVNNKISAMETDIESVSTSVDQLSEALDNLGADVEGQGYVTEAQLQEKGYVTEESLAESDYVTEAELAELGYVTETELDEKGYLTGMTIATTSNYGVVKPSSNDFYFDDNGYLRKYGVTLDRLTNVIVTTTTPTTIYDGFWYIMPWAGDG